MRGTMSDSGRITIIIEKAAFGGYGLGFHNGKAVFVSGALRGETVTAMVTEAKKYHAFAALCEVLSPSSARIEPACPNFGRCGGCDYLHADYGAELAMKRDILAESLVRIAKIPYGDIPAVETVAGERFGYRSIASVKTDSTGAVGFFRRGTNDLVAFPRGGCPLLWEPLRAFRPQAAAFAHSEVKIAAGADGALHSELEGSPVIREVERDTVYERSIHCFFQANRHLRARMTDLVLEMTCVGHGERFLDLACGVGYFTIPLGMRSGSGVGRDIEPESVRWAGTNAAINGVRNLKFAVGDFARHTTRGGRFDTIVLDPPRTGLAGGAVPAITAFKARRIVYVSCDPATFARDCAGFLKSGYRIDRLVMIDMFPATGHIETVCLLSRE